jgi:hypothetical protein
MYAAISNPSPRFLIIPSTPVSRKVHVAIKSSLLGVGGILMGMVAEVCDAVWIWLMARYDDHADHWIELILNILACREGKRKRERKSTIGH